MKKAPKDRCKTCKTELHLYCSHEVKKLLDRNKEWMIEELEYMFGDWVEWDSMKQKIEDSFKEEEKKNGS